MAETETDHRRKHFIAYAQFMAATKIGNEKFWRCKVYASVEYKHQAFDNHLRIIGHGDDDARGEKSQQTLPGTFSVGSIFNMIEAAAW